MPQRKLIVQEFVSLDGLAAGPNDDVRFVPSSMQGDQRFSQEQVAFVNECDTLVLGRVTYEMFKGYWPSVVKEGDVAELKQRPGKHIFVSGSISIVEALLSAALIDEFRLVLCPVVLDSGKKLFDRAPGTQFTLLDVNRMDRGAVLLRYGVQVKR